VLAAPFLFYLPELLSGLELEALNPRELSDALHSFLTKLRSGILRAERASRTRMRTMKVASRICHLSFLPAAAYHNLDFA
jgi:hypothetical protein